VQLSRLEEASFMWYFTLRFQNLNVTFERLVQLFRIFEFPGSVPSLRDSYVGRGFPLFPQLFQENGCVGLYFKLDSFCLFHTLIYAEKEGSSA